MLYVGLDIGVDINQISYDHLSRKKLTESLLCTKQSYNYPRSEIYIGANYSGLTI